jgi:succinyl-diaminopimelate desuccinylase
VRIEGEKLYGLGASDMKGGLAVALGLHEALPLRDLPVHVLLVLYDREEGGYAENGLEPLFASVSALSRLKLAVCLEPTDGQLQLGCVGGLQATVAFHGKSAHSARPWQGENAIHRAGELLAELHRRERVRVECDGLEFFEVMSATLAKGGTARNVVPDRFELNINTRFAPGKSLEQAEAELRALVGNRAEVLVTDRSPSGRVCLDHPWVKQLAEGGRLPITSKQAWTDVARFGVRGIDAINFGPGATSQAHQANEWIEVAALERGAATLASWILALR